MGEYVSKHNFNILVYIENSFFFYTETLRKSMRYKLETPLIAKAKPFFFVLFYASDVSIKCGMYIIMLFI